MRARACMRMREQAWRATQCAASKKKERPANKRVGTLNKKKARRVLPGPCGRWGRRVNSYIKERVVVYVLWCEEDRGQRKRRMRHGVCNNTVLV